MSPFLPSLKLNVQELDLPSSLRAAKYTKSSLTTIFPKLQSSKTTGLRSEGLEKISIKGKKESR